MQILVADDDSTSRLILQRCIEKEGHTCWTAASGDEAWLIYQTRPVDVVISDWLMPGLDGLQLCERVRKSTTHGYTFFIMLTSLGDRDHRKIAMMAGADDFLSKPLDREDLQLRLIAAERVTTLHHRLHFQKDQFERLNQQLVEEKARAEELTQQLEQRVQDRTRQLKASSDGIRRFVPTEFLKALGYEDVSRLRLGDATARSMTILVADVHDFTQLTSGLSPEETLAWLNRCFSLLGPCIRQHGGFVHRYVEDALIALFPGDPRKAVLAAADMQRQRTLKRRVLRLHFSIFVRDVGVGRQRRCLCSSVWRVRRVALAARLLRTRRIVLTLRRGDCRWRHHPVICHTPLPATYSILL